MFTSTIKQDTDCFFCGPLKKLIERVSARMKTYIHKSEDVHAFLKKRGYLRRRSMVLIFLGPNNAVIGTKKLRLSAIRTFRAYRKYVMEPCAEMQARQVIIAHTQTNRDPALSPMDDRSGTYVIQQSLLSGNHTFDYVIAAQKGYISFREDYPSKWQFTLDQLIT